MTIYCELVIELQLNEQPEYPHYATVPPVSVAPWIPYSSLCPASQCATLRITPMIAWSVLCDGPEHHQNISKQADQ